MEQAMHSGTTCSHRWEPRPDAGSLASSRRTMLHTRKRCFTNSIEAYRAGNGCHSCHIDANA
jgi:hypothetical protein